jgi:hypothetical protein
LQGCEIYAFPRMRGDFDGFQSGGFDGLQAA